MKTSELIHAERSTAAKIARQLVQQASHNIVPQDLEPAVERAIARFVEQLRNAAKEEIRFAAMNTPKIQ